MAQKIIYAVFPDHDSADNAISALEARGYDRQNISVMVRQDVIESVSKKPSASSALEGALEGAAAGGVIAGVVGLLVGISAIAIPGIGGLLIGGPLAGFLGLTGAAATTVSAGATGALAGGLIGGLIGLGIPRETAEFYQEKVEAGGVLIAVSIDDDSSEADLRQLLTSNAAENIIVIDR
jgi:hypothetical protein